MILKIKRFFLLIFFVLLQSCSGGKIGNFLESSFDNLEKRDKAEDMKNLLKDKKVSNYEKLESNKTFIEKKKIENKLKKFSDNKSEFDVENKIEKSQKTKQIKKTNKASKIKNSQNKSVFDVENKIEKSQKTKQIKKTNKANKIKNSQNKGDNELQSYKIIFILKDVDPKDPIEELSTILRNSELNFEIEKIERFLDSKNKKINRN